MLQLHKVDGKAKEYAEFLHMPGQKITDYGNLVQLLILCMFSL